MTLPLKGSIPLDDASLELVHNGTAQSVTDDLQHRLEQEHGRGKVTTIYDGHRSLDYEFILDPNPALGGNNKLEPPFNQVDASNLKDKDSLVAQLYGTAMIDPELVDAIQLARVALCTSSTITQLEDGTYAPLSDAYEDDAIKCKAINRLGKFLAIFSNDVQQ